MSRKILAKAALRRVPVAEPQNGAWMEPGKKDPNSHLLFLYGAVGDEWEGFTSEQVVRLISGLSGNKLIVHINSLGGAVWEGIAVYNHLLAYPGEVEVVIDGLAASIASLIAMAGDVVKMPDTAMMMIHNPWTVSAGEADDLRSDADLLDKVRDTCINAYSSKSNKSYDDTVAIMKASSYYTSAEAVSEGFADEEITRSGVAERIAALDLTQLDMSKAPQSLRALAHSSVSRQLPAGRGQSRPLGGSRTMKSKQQSASLMVAVAAGLTTAFDTLAVDTQTGTELKSQMAEISNLQVEDIDAILAGEKTDISLDQVDQMAFVLDTDLHTLMGAEPQAPEPPADPVEAFAAAVKGKKLGVNASVAAFTNDPVAVLDSIINAATDAAAEKRESDVVARAKDIKDKCRQANRPEMAMELFLEGLSPEETRERLLNELASQQRIDTTLSTEASLGGHQPAAIDTYAIYEKRRKAS